MGVINFMSKLFNIQSCADYCGVSRAAVYSWVEKGVIPYERLGKSIVFDRNVIKTWALQRRINNPSNDSPIDNNSMLKNLRDKMERLERSFEQLTNILDKLNTKFENEIRGVNDERYRPTGGCSIPFREGHGDLK